MTTTGSDVRPIPCPDRDSGKCVEMPRFSILDRFVACLFGISPGGLAIIYNSRGFEQFGNALRTTPDWVPWACLAFAALAILSIMYLTARERHKSLWTYGGLTSAWFSGFVAFVQAAGIVQADTIGVTP